MIRAMSPTDLVFTPQVLGQAVPTRSQLLNEK
jgi:hypothetical protein